jgi:hypothetical protein
MLQKQDFKQKPLPNLFLSLASYTPLTSVLVSVPKALPPFLVLKDDNWSHNWLGDSSAIDTKR